MFYRSNVPINHFDKTWHAIFPPNKTALCQLHALRNKLIISSLLSIGPQHGTYSFKNQHKIEFQRPAIDVF
jgi:hypothetical protein